MSRNRMRELVQAKETSDRVWVSSTVIAVLTILQDMYHPDFLPGETDWFILIPTLTAACLAAFRSMHLEEKIEERREFLHTDLFESSNT